MARTRGAEAHSFLPASSIYGPCFDAVRRNLARLDVAAVRTREQFGRATVVDHPILGALSVDQWLTFHLIHTRHQEKQIRARR